MRKIRGARKAPMPGFIEPQLATLKAKPPTGDYLHELKFDVYRIQPHIVRGHATIYTRSGLDWTKRFRPIVEALDQNISAILDGEVVVVEDNRPNFSLLQADLASGRKNRMALYLFDVLFLDGQDLRGVPLIERKQILESLRGKFRSPVFLSEHFDVDGAEMFESADRLGLEGIVSKRKDAPYKSGRTETWIKVKCVRKGRFPIIGFIPDVGGVSALYLGKREGRELLYAGKVGSGFSQKTSMSVRKKLEPLVTKESRLTRKVRKPKAKWVEPKFWADVEYRDITADGLLRQSALKGMDEA
jgi:bifunctional non-homologous end joining protein LigD